MKKIPKYILLIIFTICLIPLAMALLMYVPIFSFAKGNVEGWLGFWGSFIGGSLGAVGVIVTTYFLIEADKENSRKIAELNDQTERDRINTTFLLNKNEELMQVFSEIFELNSKRYNLLRSCVTVVGDIDSCNLKRQELIRQKYLSEKNIDIQLKKLKQKYDSLVSRRRELLENETNVRGKIITLLASAQIKITYFNNLENDVSKFKTELSYSLDYFYNLFEEGEISKTLYDIIEISSEKEMKDLNLLMKKCAANLERIQQKFINK